MSEDASIEKLFPFVLRTRGLIVGRQALASSKSLLHFILVTRDISPASRETILNQFSHYPVVQCYVSEDLERFFDLRGTKAIGFKKSGLAKSIYAGLKQFRLTRRTSH